MERVKLFQLLYELPLCRTENILITVTAKPHFTATIRKEVIFESTDLEIDRGIKFSQLHVDKVNDTLL